MIDNIEQCLADHASEWDGTSKDGVAAVAREELAALVSERNMLRDALDEARRERDAAAADLDAERTTRGVEREALGLCVEGMRAWGAEEDGIYYGAWPAYLRAMELLGRSDEVRAALKREADAKRPRPAVYELAASPAQLERLLAADPYLGGFDLDPSNDPQAAIGYASSTWHGDATEALLRLVELRRDSLRVAYLEDLCESLRGGELEAALEESRRHVDGVSRG